MHIFHIVGGMDMKTKKKVTLQLQPIELTVEVPEGATEKEILKIADTELAVSVQKKTPTYKYIITEGNTLSLEGCSPGRVIRYKDEIGYIFEVKHNRKLPVSIVLSGRRLLNVLPIILESVEDESLVGSVWNERYDIFKKENVWSVGDTAFLPVGERIEKVILSKVTKSQILAHPLSTQSQTKYFPIKSSQIQFLSDTEEEAKKFLKKR